MLLWRILVGILGSTKRRQVHRSGPMCASQERPEARRERTSACRVALPASILASRWVRLNVRDSPGRVSTKSAKPNDKKSIISRGAVGTLGPIMKSGDDTYFDLTPEALLVPLALS